MLNVKNMYNLMHDRHATHFLFLYDFREQTIFLSKYSSSQVHLHVIFPSFPENLKSIPYRIMGYFRIAKFSRFCLKKHGDYFSRILILAVATSAKNKFDSFLRQS